MILKIALIVLGVVLVLVALVALYVLWVLRDMFKEIGGLGDEYLQGNIR